MDAGNFSKINNVGFTPKAPVRKAETQSDGLPADQVTIGAAPVANEGKDVSTVGAPKGPVVADGADQIAATSHTPGVDGGFIIAGVSQSSGTERIKFDVAGANGVNGSTQLFCEHGRCVADISPLASLQKPVENWQLAPAEGMIGVGASEGAGFYGTHYSI